MSSMLSSIYFGKQGMWPKALEALLIHQGAYSPYAFPILAYFIMIFILLYFPSPSSPLWMGQQLAILYSRENWGNLLNKGGFIGGWGWLYFDCGSPLHVLQQEVPKVVKSLNKQLREKSLKTKVNFSSLL
jgi:hypothetical protein